MLGHDTAQSTQVYGRIHKQHMRSVAARLGQRKPRHANAGTR
jgi:site-specific recombinase XerD